MPSGRPQDVEAPTWAATGIKTPMAVSNTVEDPHSPGQHAKPIMNRDSTGRQIRGKSWPVKFASEERQLLLIPEA
jgi:hypothetical protein